MLSRKHYKEIAKIINLHLSYDNMYIERYGHDDFVDALADYFKEDNNRFDKGRFLDACHEGGLDADKQVQNE